MISTLQKADIIVEALPYINVLRDKFVVIKYGGNAMNDPQIVHSIMQDVATLRIVGVNVVLVHGGGPEINTMLARLGIESRFCGGLRVTDEATMEVVQMVLGGKVNKNVVTALGQLGVRAVGLCGGDASLIKAKKLAPKNGVDLGQVGEIVSINGELIQSICRDGCIPVIATIGVDEQGKSYNINADSAASAIAEAVRAAKLLFLTDIDGIRSDPDDPATLISEITTSQILALIEGGAITGGMIPKAQGCVDSIRKGIGNVHIISGIIRHSILLEIFTDKGIGTVIKDG